MNASAIEARLQFHLLFWYGVMTVAVLFAGMLLAANLYAIAFVIAATGWMVTLPYHGKLSVVLAVVTFRAAFIVPFLPGRPFFWEVGAMLAWTGVPLSILLRKYPPDTGGVIRENRWVFIGAFLYSTVLLVTMLARGTGLGALGSGVGGGRFYIQQILSAIFPLLFVMVPLNEKSFPRLVVIQFLLTITFVVSDVAYSVLPGALQPLLYFFELSTDAMNFEQQSLEMGIRRFQSLGWFFPSLVYALLILYRPRDFSGRRMFWLVPLASAAVGISLLSGSRTVLVIPPAIVFLTLWTQRFFDVRKVIMGGLIGIAGLILVYGAARSLPLAAQRAVSFLPGVQVSNQAASDAHGTVVARKILAKIGLSWVPRYLWLGRGFSVNLRVLPRNSRDATIEMHLAAGRFYNGIVGLLVNTGLFGFLAFLLFVYGGSKVAVRILRHGRRYGAEDMLTRASILVASIWLTEVVHFFFLHGDAEWAMRKFGFQAGLLLAAERLLRHKLAAQAAANTATMEESRALTE